jgi:hypothetical protein
MLPNLSPVPPLHCLLAVGTKHLASLGLGISVQDFQLVQFYELMLAHPFFGKHLRIFQFLACARGLALDLALQHHREYIRNGSRHPNPRLLAQNSPRPWHKLVYGTLV